VHGRRQRAAILRHQELAVERILLGHDWLLALDTKFAYFFTTKKRKKTI
jgi:hypothetical protein